MTAPSGLHNRKSLEPYVKDSVRFYEHQAEGVRFLLGKTKQDTKRGVLIADDMGLGKSLVATAAFGGLIKRQLAQTAIVICPASLKQNWAREMDKFTRFQYVVIPGTGSTPVQRQMLLNKFKEMTGPKVLIINYEQVTAFLDQLQPLFFDVGIFDEAHYLKNPRSTRTASVRNLKTRFSYMLTGSPMPNDVTELWVMLDRINPGQWGSFKMFENTYAVFGGHKSKEIVGTKNAAQLRRRLFPVMLRRLKKDVLDLPEVQYIDRVVGMTPEQERMYEVAYNEMMVEALDGSTEGIANAAVRFTRLLQICGTTACLDPEHDHSRKLDLAVADAAELINEGHHVVVFTRWRKVQEMFVKRLEKALGRTHIVDGKRVERPPIRVLNGDVPSDDVFSKRTGELLHPSRETVKDNWEMDAPTALVCMYQVAGIGLNMTKARHGLMLDQLFVPDLNQQAIDRLHRIGADLNQSVQIFKYFVADSVENRVDQILWAKERTSAEVLDYKAAERSVLRQVIEADRRHDPYLVAA